MLKYARFDVSGRNDVNKTNIFPECNIFNYWYFLQINFRFQPKIFADCFNENHNHYYYKMFLENCSYE